MQLKYGLMADCVKSSVKSGATEGFHMNFTVISCERAKCEISLTNPVYPPPLRPGAWVVCGVRDPRTPRGKIYTKRRCMGREPEGRPSAPMAMQPYSVSGE